MADLDELRRRIDEIDRRIVELLAERLGVASEIGTEKEAAGLTVYDPERERRVLERAAAAGADRIPPESLRAIFREIISATRAGEGDERVVVHGAWGSLSHQAALARFGGSARLDLTSRAEEVFSRLEEGACGRAVVSLEAQSLEASLDRLDHFLHSRASITGEFYVRPSVGLYAAGPHAPGPVFGPPAAFVLASRWIARQSRDREFRIATSAREAVRLARESAGSVLGHPLLELEALIPVELGLEDVPEGFRRFHILSGAEAPPTGHDKTSILAVIRNAPGALHSVTGILARSGINLCWIEPKATQLGRWDHLFLLEIEGHRDEAAVDAALSSFRAELEFLQVLGSYPSERPPGRPF